MYTSTLEKIECQNVFRCVTRGTGASCSSSAISSSAFAPYLSAFFLFILSLVTTTIDLFQFRSQLRLSQINEEIPIRLKLKLYAVFIKIVGRKNQSFVGRQDIVNYWDLPSKISRNCQKSLVPKIAQHEF